MMMIMMMRNKEDDCEADDGVDERGRLRTLK